MLVKRKGFTRIIEVVLLSFILLVVLLPNILPNKPFYEINDWKEIGGYLICNDLLNSLDKNKTLNDLLVPDKFNPSVEYDQDINLLKNITKKAFPSMIDFDYEIKGISSYNISVVLHSDCSIPSEIFQPNYPPVNFNTDLFTIANLFINDSYDVYVVCGDINLSQYDTNIINLLKKGKGLVLIRNFTSQPDLLTQNLFEVNYTFVGLSSGNLFFNNLSNPNTGGIAKRFVNNLIRISTPEGNGKMYLRDNEYNISIIGNLVNITNCVPNLISEGDNCTIAGIAEVSLFQIDLANNWIDMEISSNNLNPRNYIFEDGFIQSVNLSKHTILSNGNYALANARVLEYYSKHYEIKPRVFWIYNFNTTKDDLKLLLKTGIIWASGEHFFTFNKEIPENMNHCIHYYSGLKDNNIPFLVKLFYWGY
jgi:hypothetical protein